MSISLECDCGRTFRVKDEAAGRKVRCPDCQQALAVPAADEDPFASDEGRDARSSSTRSRKKHAKSTRNSQPLLIGGGIGAVVIVIFGLSGYLMFRSDRAEVVENNPAISPVIAHEAAPATTAPVSGATPPIDFISPDVLDPAVYGGPVPEGYVLSPTLIREMYRMSEGSFTKNVPPADVGEMPADFQVQLREGIKTTIREIRSSYPKMFCLKPDIESQMAQGQGDRTAEQRRYDEFYSLLEKRELETPGIVVEFHQEAKSGNASLPRLTVLVTFLGYKLLKAEESSGRP